MQVPPWQASPPVEALPAPQGVVSGVPAATKPSAGQALLAPSQLSATSQAPAAGRQTAVLFASAGQVALVPVQVSAASHGPADARQTVALEANWQKAVQQEPGVPFPAP